MYRTCHPKPNPFELFSSKMFFKRLQKDCELNKGKNYRLIKKQKVDGIFSKEVFNQFSANFCAKIRLKIAPKFFTSKAFCKIDFFVKKCMKIFRKSGDYNLPLFKLFHKSKTFSIVSLPSDDSFLWVCLFLCVCVCVCVYVCVSSRTRDSVWLCI